MIKNWWYNFNWLNYHGYFAYFIISFGIRGFIYNTPFTDNNISPIPFVVAKQITKFNLEYNT